MVVRSSTALALLAAIVHHRRPPKREVARGREGSQEARETPVILRHLYNGRAHGAPVESLTSLIKTTSPEFTSNRDRMVALLTELKSRTAQVREGGGARYVARHREQGKLPVRERIEKLLDPETPFLELSALAAWDLYDNEAPAAGIITGIGRVSG